MKLEIFDNKKIRFVEFYEIRQDINLNIRIRNLYFTFARKLLFEYEITYFSHIETPISERISSDEYIWHLLRPLPGKQNNGIDVGYYPETSTRVPLGSFSLLYFI